MSNNNNTIINHYYYISPEDADKDEDGDVIMTDYVEDKNVTNTSCIIDGDTTSVSTCNENDDDDDDDYDY